jgi:hypothetical protein
MKKPTRDNYAIQTKLAQERFLTYDQQELIARCRLRYDDDYFYICFLGSPYRICRKSGCMERKTGDNWIDANSFHEVMTILDWLCDSKSDRYITGRWINVVSHRHYFHGNLQEDEDPTARFFDQNPEAFARACRNLGGEAEEGADVSYAIELVDGLKVLVQLWHGDEEFAPRLRCLWDENTEKYLRYETTWYAVGLLMRRIREQM